MFACYRLTLFNHFCGHFRCHANRHTVSCPCQLLTNYIDLSDLERARNLKALEMIDFCACKCDIMLCLNNTRCIFIMRYHRAGSTDTKSTCSNLSKSHYFSTRRLMSGHTNCFGFFSRG